MSQAPEENETSADPQRSRPVPDWAEAVALVLIARAAFLGIAYAAAWFLADTQGPFTEGLFDIWVRWDARHFQQAAEFGYTDPRTDPHITAFFPLFPLLMKGLNLLGLSFTMGGMLITTVATAIAAVFLHRWADEELGEGSGRRAVLYLLLFPTGVFLVAPYSEAVFLAGAIPAFYFARTKRWALVGVPAAVAVGARFAGVYLLIGLAVEFARQRDFARRTVVKAATALGVACLPLLAYGAYLAQIKGSAFYFFTDQKEGWGRTFTNPVSAFRTTWETYNGGYDTQYIFAWRLEIVAALAGLLFVVWALARREWGFAAFMGALLATLVTSFVYQSIPRILLSMFPIMLLLASWARDEARHSYLIAALAPIAGLGVVVFTQFRWFF